MLVDKQVTWEKLKGKPDASMQEVKGQGFLGSLPKPLDRLFISGDKGITTSTVKSVTIYADHYVVETKNSIYKITPVQEKVLGEQQK